MEVKLIAEHSTFNPELGYNCTLGGEGCRKYETIEDFKQARNLRRNKERLMVKETDPEKYQYRLKQMREIKKQYQEDPIMHKKLLAANQRCHLAKRSTPEGRAEDNAATYKIKCDVKQIRNELRSLYEKYPNLFTEEDFHIIFDRRQTPNKSWVFTYNSKTTLTKILIRIKEELDDTCC